MRTYFSAEEEGSTELRGKVADFGLSGIEKDIICGTWCSSAKRENFNHISQILQISYDHSHISLCTRELQMSFILLSEIVTKLYFRSNTGTTAYMAPELLRKSWKEGDSSKPADVYAFGVILWEAMHQRRATTRRETL